MFEGFTTRTLDFMWDLRFNNNRGWFLENKERYQKDLLAPMKTLAEEVYKRICENYGDRGFSLKISRIYKDARRVKGGDPYRDHLWFSLENRCEDTAAVPVFWFELMPESWSCGLGYYRAGALTMAKLRAEIDKSPEIFEGLINPLFEQTEFKLEGEEYVRKKEAPTEKSALFYNRKSFSLIHEQANGDEIFSSGLADRLVRSFEFLMPFYDYFIKLEAH